MGQSLQSFCSCTASGAQDMDTEPYHRHHPYAELADTDSPPTTVPASPSASASPDARGPGYADEGRTRERLKDREGLLGLTPKMSAGSDVESESDGMSQHGARHPRMKTGQRISDTSILFKDDGSHRFAFYEFQVERFVAENIMTDEKYEDKRMRLEDEITSLDDINSVEYDPERACWMIVAETGRAIKKSKKYLDVVAWRMLVIPQWRSAHNSISGAVKPLDGVWYFDDVLGFMSDFGMEDQAREELELIDDEQDNYEYLASKQHLPLHSPEFLEFSQQAAAIRHARTVEIVVIGSRADVTDFIRQVRMLEIEHPVMKTTLELEARKRKLKMIQHDEIVPIPSNLLKISNLPAGVTRHEIVVFLGKISHVLSVRMFRDNRKDEMFAKVNFATPEERAKVLIESKTSAGIVWDGTTLVVEDFVEEERVSARNRPQRRKRKRQRSLRRLF